MLTLALVWQLMRKYTLTLLAKLSPDGSPIVESEIIHWANQRLEGASKGISIRSFQVCLLNPFSMYSFSKNQFFKIKISKFLKSFALLFTEQGKKGENYSRTDSLQEHSALEWI